MDYANSCRDWCYKCRLFLGMLAPTRVVISEHNDIVSDKICSASLRKPISSAAERGRQQAKAIQGIHILLTFRPIDVISDHLSVERIGPPT